MHILVIGDPQSFWVFSVLGQSLVFLAQKMQILLIDIGHPQMTCFGGICDKSIVFCSLKISLGHFWPTKNVNFDNWIPLNDFYGHLGQTKKK